MKGNIWFKCHRDVYEGTLAFMAGNMYFFEDNGNSIISVDETGKRYAFMLNDPDDFNYHFTPATESEIREHLGEGQNTIKPNDPSGLTKREVFAVMALQGLISNSLVMEAIATYPDKSVKIELSNLASSAISIADALIEALNNKQG